MRPRKSKDISLGLIFLALPVMMLGANYSACNKAGDSFAYEYGMNIFNSMDENAVFLCGQDNTIFLLWYLRYVEGKRKDIRLISRYALDYPGYLEQLKHECPELDVPVHFKRTDKDYYRKAVIYMIEHNFDKGPMYWEVHLDDDSFVYQNLVPYGLICKVKEKPGGPIAAQEIAAYYKLWERYYLQFGKDPLFWNDINATQPYAAARNNAANLFSRRGHLDLAIREFEGTFKLYDKFYQTHDNIAGLYFQRGLLDKAEAHYRRALELEPEDKIAKEGLSLIAKTRLIK